MDRDSDFEEFDETPDENTGKASEQHETPSASTASHSAAQIPWKKLLRALGRDLLRPARFFRKTGGAEAGISLGIVALFFGLYFLSVGTDWLRAGLMSGGRVWAFFLMGLLTGGTAALLFAAVTAGGTVLLKKERISPFSYLAPIAAATVLPGLLLLFGLLIGGIFSTPISASVGITALLWWLWLLIELLRGLWGGKKLFPILTWVTVFGGILFTWLNVTVGLK